MGRSTARAATSRQSQPQTQRGRGSRRAAAEEEPEEEDEAQEEEAEGEEMDVDEGNSELSRKSNDLVRLALFTEHRRVPLRRDEINKKAMGSSTRSFNVVFEMAQNKLRNTFGMELVELPSRAGLEQETAGEDPNEGLAGTGMKKKATALGSKTYILRSTLDPILVERAAQTTADVLEEEANDQRLLFPSQLGSDDEGDDSDDDAERSSKYYGSLLSWTKGDQLGSTGILYVILSLVLVSGRVMPDVDLRRHLKALGLSSNPTVHPVHHTSAATTRALALDAYLTHLLKQGYLDRQEIGGEAAVKKGKKGGGQKRLRTQAEDLEDGRTYEWRWGPRAFCEVGEEFVAKFIAEFMVGSNVEDEEEGGAGHARHEALVKKMFSGIEKAAGGKLSELR